MKGALKPCGKADWYNCFGEQFGRPFVSMVSHMPKTDSGHSIQGTHSRMFNAASSLSK